MSEAASERARGSHYFFLSYAHSPPLEVYQQEDQDRWVGRFFRDLSAEVKRHAAPGSGLGAGFFDQAIPLGKASLNRALGTAEVFVPLYYPGYFARSWPGREWACFHRRVTRAGVAEPLRRFVPVLWVPLSGQQDAPGLSEALADCASIPEYAENGLRALLRLQPYHDAYAGVVEHLARRIVAVAQESPLPVSDITNIDEERSPFAPEAAAKRFMVAVAAPTVRNVPAGSDPGYYGEKITDWRPFPQHQRLPLAEYAKAVAERLDFAVMITEIVKKGERFTTWPGVILIDPWLYSDPAGLQILTSALSDLPPWVLPLLVPSLPDDLRLSELCERVESILQGADSTRPAESQRVPGAVSSLQGFVSAMPVLVAEAERQYLRHGPGATVPPGPPGPFSPDPAARPARAPGEAGDG